MSRRRTGRAGTARIVKNPVTLQLRYLQTLTEIAVEKNSTILFPLPMDIMRAFIDREGSAKQGASHVSDSHEPSYYEIALTNRQVIVAFVILLLCLISAFFSGVWIGRESGDRAAGADRAAPPPPAEENRRKGRTSRSSEFFEAGRSPAPARRRRRSHRRAEGRPRTPRCARTSAASRTAEGAASPIRELAEGAPAPNGAPRRERQQHEEEKRPGPAGQAPATPKPEPSSTPTPGRRARAPRPGGHPGLLLAREGPGGAHPRPAGARRPQGLPLAGRGGRPHHVPRPHRPVRLARRGPEGRRAGPQGYKLDTWVTE